MRRHVSIVMLCFVLSMVPASKGAYDLTFRDIIDDGHIGDVIYAGTFLTAYTGELGVSIRDDTGTPLLADDGSDVFSAFCIELDQPVSVGSEFPVDIVLPSPVRGGLEAAWLMENRDTYLVPEWSPWEISALQLAIWEVTHDPDASHSYSLNSGNFIVQSFPNESVLMANTYLGSLAAHFSPVGLESHYVATINPEYQDMIVAMGMPGDDVDPIPEPATLGLLGTGLICLAGTFRRMVFPR